jgi:hypothetical protein
LVSLLHFPPLSRTDSPRYIPDKRLGALPRKSGFGGEEREIFLQFIAPMYSVSEQYFN